MARQAVSLLLRDLDKKKQMFRGMITDKLGSGHLSNESTENFLAASDPNLEKIQSAKSQGLKRKRERSRDRSKDYEQNSRILDGSIDSNS